MKPTCSFENLQLYAYGFLEGGEMALLESHLLHCAECREELERLQAEVQIMSFELSLEPGVSEAEPLAPRPSEKILHRMPRLVYPAVAAAALLLVVTAFFSMLGSNAPPSDDLEWRRLPDGTRISSLPGASVRGGSTLRSLEIDDGSLVIDVVPGETAFTVETPHGTVLSDAGRFEVTVDGEGTRLEVLAGAARFEPREAPVVKRPGTPDEDRVVVYDGNPALLVYIRELITENDALRKLYEDLLARSPGEAPGPIPTDPDEAVTGHDWAGLAEVLGEIAPHLQRGRLPRDPRVLLRYLAALERLDPLARVLGLDEPSLALIASDPRTGPKLFTAALAQVWPGASSSDLSYVEGNVERILEDHAARDALAQTSAEKTAAKAALEEELAREVEEFELRQGKPLPEDRPPEVKPQQVSPEPPEPDRSGSNQAGAGQTGSEQGQAETPGTDVRLVLSSAGYQSDPERVYTGTERALAQQVVKGWMGDYGLSYKQKRDLWTIATGWVREYEAVLRQNEPAVVATFEARLGRGEAVPGIRESEVLGLRSELLTVQAGVEKKVVRLISREGGRLPAGATSVATFFLIQR